MSQPRTFLRRKMPHSLSFVLVPGVIIMLLGSLSAIFQAKQYDVAALAIIFMGGMASLLYLIDYGYQMSWDENNFYSRLWGYKGMFKRHPEVAIAFVDVKSIKAKFDGNAGPKSRFYPFDYIEVKSIKRGVKAVWIHPMSFKDRDVKNLLLYFHAKRPELFPQDVIDYMHSDRPL